MSNIDELPDLAGDVRDRAVPPPYEQVTQRVRARRLRTATGTMAAAVVTVGGIAVWQNAATTASPSPAPPITQPADPAYPASPEWRQVVAGTDSHPFDTQGTDDGSIAVVWRALEHPEPTFALVIREPDGTVHGRRLDSPVSLTPVPGGWVGLRTERAWFIGTDGTWTDLGSPGDARKPRAGDVFINGQFGRWLYSPGDRTWASPILDQPVVDQAYVTPDGTLVTCTRVGENKIHVRRGVSLAALAHGSSCVLTGNGDTASVLGLGDAPDGDIPLTSFLRSADGGVAWTTPSHEAMSSVTSQAVSADGTIVVTGTDGRSFVVAPDGSTAEPEVDLGVVFAAGDRVYATSYSQSKGLLLYSDDDGATWQETTLPGLE